jgi:large subunit ribosomal protein L20
MRVKRGFKARQRRKKVLKLAKGFRGGRSKLFRTDAANYFVPQQMQSIKR